MKQQSFVRDPLTWLSYGLLACYSYYISALGPIVPFLRRELALDFTLSGLHLSAWSAGVACVGLLSDVLVRRIGRRAMLWCGVAVLALFTLSLIAGTSVWITLPSVFGMGFGAGALLIMIQALLADHHGPLRTRALSEANVSAMLSGSVAPLFIGGAARIGLSWRVALLLGVIALATLFALSRRVSMSTDAPVIETAGRNGRLPRLFWWYWLVIFLCVAIEWCIAFWAASFLVTVIGFSEPVAATLLSLFLLAMLLGRLGGSFLTEQFAAPRLLALALLVVALGFLLFWLAPTAPLTLIGLFVTGFGVANLYPLSLALAMGTAPQLANRASARATLGSSVATLILPLVLGSLADQIGIFRAFALVVVVVVAALIVLWWAQRYATAHPATNASTEARPTAP